MIENLSIGIISSLIASVIFATIAIIFRKKTVFKWFFGKIFCVLCWFKNIFSINKLNIKINILEKEVAELKNKKTSFSSVKNEIKNGEDFLDDRNGYTYKTVAIGNQIWMAEDLNYMPRSTMLYADRQNTYNWETAKKAAPLGWHLPSKEEWLELIKFVGGIAAAGKKLKAKVGWSVGYYVNCNGTDDFGFAALPYSESDDRNDCSWWSATERDSDAFVVTIEADSSIKTGYAEKKYSRKFVRCIKD